MERPRAEKDMDRRTPASGRSSQLDGPVTVPGWGIVSGRGQSSHREGRSFRQRKTSTGGAQPMNRTRPALLEFVRRRHGRDGDRRLPVRL